MSGEPEVTRWFALVDAAGVPVGNRCTGGWEPGDEEPVEDGCTAKEVDAPKDPRWDRWDEAAGAWTRAAEAEREATATAERAEVDSLSPHERERRRDQKLIERLRAERAEIAAELAKVRDGAAAEIGKLKDQVAAGNRRLQAIETKLGLPLPPILNAPK